MAKKSKSSKRWLAEHASDEFVKRAHEQGWRSRAVFKLEEIQKRDHLFRPGMTIVDLGAAPGAWSQYARFATKEHGRVIALDLLAMDALPGVTFIQGDFREEATLQELQAALGQVGPDRVVDLVMSDIAPNTSGQMAVDQPRSIYLAELALDFAQETLKSGGHFVVKIFQGEGSQELLAAARQKFEVVNVRKPRASRPRSREVYFVARNYRL
jgi:23S rRNA (uridine2552-2'-O)-methyltransferase